VRRIASADGASGAFAAIGTATHFPAAALVAGAAIYASDAAFAAALGHSAAACASAADMAARAFAPPVVLADGITVAAGRIAAAPFWSAVSFDATRVEEGATASVIAGSPLWPQGQPDQHQSLWQELKAALHATGQDWEVWTIWYDDRLAGYPFREEERELAYVRIDESLWAKGPAIVNAEIRRRIEEFETPPRVVDVLPWAWPVTQAAPR
jgi:hypothetical protein